MWIILGGSKWPSFFVKNLYETKLRPNKWIRKEKSFVIILNIDTYKTLSVPETGLEPARPCEHWSLKPARLPIPPLGHFATAKIQQFLIATKNFFAKIMMQYYA